SVDVTSPTILALTSLQKILNREKVCHAEQRMHRDQVSNVNCTIDVVHADTRCETAKQCPIPPAAAADPPQTAHAPARLRRCLPKLARTIDQFPKIRRLVLNLFESSTGIGKSHNLFLADDNWRVRIDACALPAPQPHNRIGPILGILLSKTARNKRW